MPATSAQKGKVHLPDIYNYNMDMTAEKKRQEKRIRELKKMILVKEQGAEYSSVQLADIKEIDKKFRELGIIDSNGDVTSFYRKEP